MKKKILLVLVLLLAGCTTKDSYDLDAIHNLVLAPASKNPRSLSYSVRMETAYSSPGLRRTRKDGVDHLRVVRCKIGKTCAVDIPATLTGDVAQAFLPVDLTAQLILDGWNGKTLEIATGR